MTFALSCFFPPPPPHHHHDECSEIYLFYIFFYYYYNYYNRHHHNYCRYCSADRIYIYKYMDICVCMYRIKLHTLVQNIQLFFFSCVIIQIRIQMQMVPQKWYVRVRELFTVALHFKMFGNVYVFFMLVVREFVRNSICISHLELKYIYFMMVMTMVIVYY